jgi:hypothetical protein
MSGNGNGWKMIKVYIHTGSLSADNGAKNPLLIFFELGRAVGPYSIHTGVGYYDDYLEVEESVFPTVLDLILEEKLLYRIEGEHNLGDWQNILTSKVRSQLKGPFAPLVGGVIGVIK